jgi:hypothetical protein
MLKKENIMANGSMCSWSSAASRKIIVYHLILFFIITPFLASCGSSGGTDGTNNTSGTDPVADTASDQNRSAKDAILGAVDLAIAIDSGRGLIEDFFGSMDPSQEEIKEFVENNLYEAANLIGQLEVLAADAQSGADEFNASIEELKRLENIIINSIGKDIDASVYTSRDARALGLVGSALVILTVIGAAAAAGKGAADAIHECDYIVLCDPMPDTKDPKYGDCVVKITEKLACYITKWPRAAAEAITGTISTGVTTVASWAAGVQEWKTIKFLIDAYSTYDSADSIKKAFGIRRCDQDANSFMYRQIQEVDIDTLTPDDVYIGTSENGTFYNVPEGYWTFLLLEDGQMRKVSHCVDATGESPMEEHVTLIPIEAIQDNDKDGFLGIEGDCDDQNPSTHPDAIEDCTDGIDNNCNTFFDCDDSQCDGDAACQGSQPETIVNVNVDIPGHGTFNPDFKIAGLGTCSSSSSLFPTIYAGSGGMNPDPLNDDILSIVLNNDLGVGTWDLATGECDTPHVFFSTKDILEEGFVWPVGFSSYSGSITLEEYGTQYGDRLKGSFSVQVDGSQQLCPTPECDVYKEITGTISGSFDGIITEYTSGN